MNDSNHSSSYNGKSGNDEKAENNKNLKKRWHHEITVTEIPLSKQPKTTNYILRPHAIEFLEALNEMFTLAIWTSMTKRCAKPIIADIFSSSKFNLLFTWYQTRCKKIPVVSETDNDPSPLFLKVLSYVWNTFTQYNDQNTLLIDDSAEKCTSNPSHTCIHPKAYELDMTIFAKCDLQFNVSKMKSNRIYLNNSDSSDIKTVEDNELSIGGNLLNYLEKVSQFDGDVSKLVNEIGSYSII